MIFVPWNLLDTVCLGVGAEAGEWKKIDDIKVLIWLIIRIVFINVGVKMFWSKEDSYLLFMKIMSFKRFQKVLETLHFRCKWEKNQK